MMPPQTAKQAAANGATQYFTGKPCKRGHICARSVASRSCEECLALAQAICRQRNLVTFKEREACNRQKNRAERRQYAVDRYLSNKAAVRAASEKWRKSNKPKEAARAARRKAAKLRATPIWADNKPIIKIYREAAALTVATGVKHEVDHIIPLQSEIVCGLHVSWNLQVLTQSENARKKNKLMPAMIDAALQEKTP